MKHRSAEWIEIKTIKKNQYVYRRWRDYDAGVVRSEYLGKVTDYVRKLPRAEQGKS
jgi:hypothetical protein